MIEKMRLLTLIVPEADRVSAVERLRDLGVMQVETGTAAETPERNSLAAEVADADRALDLLNGAPETAEKIEEKDGKSAVAAVLESMRREQSLQRDLERCSGDMAALAAWGHFDASVLRRAQRFGLRIRCCVAPKKIYAELAKKFTCVPLGGGSAARRFAVLSDCDIDPDELPLADLPAAGLAELEKKAEELRRLLAEEKARRSALRGSLEVVRAYRAERAGTLEFARVRDAVAIHERLASLTGFVPEAEVEKIRAAVREYGWGFADRAADPKRESVPTLLRTPRWVHVIRPLMDFLAISPGYDERDVSIPVLLFFTVFFGMLVGDAGYGLLFLGAALAGWCSVGRRKPAARLPLALLTLLSCAAVGWGWATGNFFGTRIPGIPWLSSDPRASQNTQLVCFSLALAQLALAHLLRMTDGGVRNILGQAGWLAVLVGNFALVYSLLLAAGPLPEWFQPALIACYGVGIVLAAVSEIDFRDVGTIFSFPFTVVSSFVDVLSYIRLFAVGMSSFYLARCFNDMAANLRASSEWMIPVAVLVLLCGHVLNIALAAMGVLVHGVRLNTLEFSSHLGLRWGGSAFAPFRRPDAGKNK